MLDDDGNFVGFDVVTGNPPYGVMVDSDIYNSSESYLCFIERAINLIKEHGYFSLIIPDSWQINNNASGVRANIAENGSLYEIKDAYKPFNDARDVWCNLIFFQKSLFDAKLKISRLEPYNLNILNFSTQFHQFSKLKGGRWFVFINENISEIFSKINKLPPIKSEFSVNRGFSPTPNLLNISLVETRRQVIGGEDFGHFVSKIKSKYLINSYIKSFNSITEILKSGFIGIQRIRTNSLDFKSRWLVRNIFSSGFVPIDSISYITSLNKNYSLNYLLGILNSYLINFYYKLHYSDKNV